LISVEEPVVWGLLDGLTPGDALDAACGTGRHARHLADLGHRVVGVDGSPEMLERARSAVPEAEYHEGDLLALPLPNASVDLAVCALALEHVADLGAAVGELARVVRPGGSIVLSDLHPTAIALGGAAFFQDASGGAGVVRGNSHLHGDYLDAFAAAGLAVRQCLEPRFGAREAAMQGPASMFIPDAAEAAYIGLPGALVWDVGRP
jgi:ubiquinone/menaquinone biosynthesis C-methylase UbiE